MAETPDTPSAADALTPADLRDILVQVGTLLSTSLVPPPPEKILRAIASDKGGALIKQARECMGAVYAAALYRALVKLGGDWYTDPCIARHGEGAVHVGGRVRARRGTGDGVAEAGHVGVVCAVEDDGRWRIWWETNGLMGFSPPEDLMVAVEKTLHPDLVPIPAPSVLPIPMILYCPACGVQHVDKPTETWSNPPHRSHLCHACGCVWRPADVPTTGVAQLQTRGKADTWGGT